MTKKPILIIVLMILCLSAVSAIMDDKLAGEFGFEYNDTWDSSGNARHLTDGGCNRVTGDAITGNGSLQCAGNVHMDFTTNMFDLDIRKNFSVVTFFKIGGRSAVFTITGDFNGGNGYSLYADSNGFLEGYIYPNNHRFDTDVFDVDGADWIHLAFVANTTELVLFVNGNRTNAVAFNDNIGDPGAVVAKINDRADPVSNSGTATYDNFCWYTEALNQSAILQLYNNGTGANCSTIAAVPPPPPLQQSGNRIEGTTDIDQPAPVTIGSSTFSPVITGTFNATANIPIYASYISNIQFLNAVNPSTVDCQLNFDGQIRNSTISRSNAGLNNFASIKGSTIIFNYTTTGFKNITLECKGNNAVSFDVENSNIIIHHLADASGVALNHLSDSFNNGLGGAVSFQLLKRVNFTTENFSLGNNEIVVIAESDYNIQYSNGSTFDAEIQVYVGNDTENQSCAPILRTGADGTTGSAAGICAWKGAMNNGSIWVQYLGRTGAGNIMNVTGNIIIKEFFTNTTETNYTQVPEQSLSNTDWQNLSAINISVNTTSNLVAQAAISVTSDASDQIDFRFIMGVTGENGTTIHRQTGNEKGVAILQDVFTLRDPGLHVLWLQTKSGLGAYNITIADFFGYFSLNQPFSIRQFNISLLNRLNNSFLVNFNATVNGVTVSDFGTGNVTISTSDLFVNIRVQKQGFINETFSNHNTNGNINISISQPGIYDVTYSNFIDYLSVNYTRNLTWDVNYTCLPTTNVIKHINNRLNETFNLTCDGTFNQISQTFQHNREGQFNTSFEFNTSFFPSLNNMNESNATWLSDLLPPEVINATITFRTDFVNPLANFTYVCKDNIFVNLNYTLNFNQVNLFENNLTNGTEHFNESTNVVNGLNNASYTCADGFGNTTRSNQTNIEVRNLILIDEQRNTAFDVQNVTSLIVFLDDNRTSFDFKANNVSQVNFIATEDVKLRFQILYPDTVFILRYVDTSLKPDDIRVCANTDEITHFEQIILSTTSQPVILNSVFSDCLVAADFTRFAFEDALSLKAYTFNNLYSLFVFDVNNNPVLLSSVDGSNQIFINIDTIEVSQILSDIFITGDQVSIQAIDNTSVEIFYINTKADNDEFDISITRTDTNTLLFTADQDDVLNINNFTIIFDWSTISPLPNATTLFEFSMVGTRTDTAVFRHIEYFNGAGQTGRIASQLAAWIAFFIIVMGVPMGSSRTIFSWFGLIMLIAALVILSLAITAWYIVFLQAITLISMIVIFVYMMGKNQTTIA